MGNNKYKFGLSEIISSGSWLHHKLPLYRPKRTKLPSPRVASKPDSVTAMVAPGDSSPRKSYHFGRGLNPEHDKSPGKTMGLKKVQVCSRCSSSSASSASKTTCCSSPTRRRSRRPSPEFWFDSVLAPEAVDKTASSSSSSSSSAPRSLSDPKLAAGDVTVGMGNLAPIATNTKKRNERKLVTSKRFSSLSSSSTNSPGIKLRTHSPRLLAAARRTRARKGATVQPRGSGLETNSKCGGFAVVKSSLDPWKDFRESMVEMIVENGIKDSEDLEELLACYLSLNSVEYHEVIVAAFQQIWRDLADITLA